MAMYERVGSYEEIIEAPAATGLVLGDDGGAFVYMDAGQVKLATGDVNIFGWAIRPSGTISADDPILITSVLGKTFRLPQTGSGSPAIGSRFGLTVSSNVQYVNTDDTTTVKVEVVAIDGNDLIVRVI